MTQNLVEIFLNGTLLLCLHLHTGYSHTCLVGGDNCLFIGGNYK